MSWNSDEKLIKEYNDASLSINSRTDFEYMMMLKFMLKDRGLIYRTKKTVYNTLNLIELSLIFKLLETHPKPISIGDLIYSLNELDFVGKYLQVLIHKGLISNKDHKISIVFGKEKLNATNYFNKYKQEA